MNQTAQVLLPVPVEHPFTYLISQEQQIKPGTYVRVPFRQNEMLGVVWDTAQATPKGRLKSVLEVMSHIPLMPEAMRQFIEWVAQYNMAPLGMVLKMAISVPQAILKPIKDLEVVPLQPRPLHLTQEQSQAADALLARLGQGHSVTMLEGVTGSGKTAVYTKVIEEVLAQGGQVLLLLPEIVLTTQLIQRLEQHFGGRPYEWHSGLSPKQRRLCWQAVATGQAQFVSGARSALFLPFSNLRLIIIDEEHDSSFKQEEGVIYNARDMAIVRAKLEKIPVVLASATPSIETVYNVKSGKYAHVTLRNRYGPAVMPKIITLDLNQHKLQRGTWLSLPLRTALADTMAQGRQSLLFINRRGYAPITMCTECGHKVHCKSCSACMVEHRSKNIMQCHYCGATAPKIKECPECGAEDQITSYGPGAERVAEEVQQFLPEARMVMMTSDTVGDHKKAAEVVNKITDNQVDIVVGTQMIAKGLHFPKLHLVGVVEADAGLTGGDLRSVERTYQLLHQVAGRAGREEVEGIVMLQTYDPDSLLLKHLYAENQEEFWRMELEGREIFHMPPYRRMAIITGSASNEVRLIGVMRQLAHQAPVLEGLQIFGPAPAPISLLRGKYRYRFIISAGKTLNLQKLLTEWLRRVPHPPSISMRVDIDPYSFL